MAHGRRWTYRSPDCACGLKFLSFFLLNATLCSPDKGSAHRQVTAAAFASAGLRGEDRMEDRHLLASPLPGVGPADATSAGPAAPPAAAPAASHHARRLGSETGSGVGSAPAAVPPAEAAAGHEAHLLCVFDGHRGAAAAEFAAEQVLAHLVGARGEPSAEAALKRAFVSLDAAFREAQARPSPSAQV